MMWAPLADYSDMKAIKKARLYHLSERTIRQIDTLAVLYGLPKEQAVAQAVEATYQAAAEALKTMKVKVAVKGPGKA